MHIFRIILFSIIVLGSGWFFYDLYGEREERSQESTPTQLSYKTPLPYFTVEQSSRHMPEMYRTAKIDYPTLFIEGNTHAAEKINAYMKRMIDDEVQRFSQGKYQTAHASSSPLLIETLSIQFEELYTHPQLISIAFHISKTTIDTPIPSKETVYAMFDGLYGSQLPLKNLFAIFNESDFATTLCSIASEKLLTPSRDECIRTTQDPKAVGIDTQQMHVFLRTSSSSAPVTIPLDMFQQHLHPNIQLALSEKQELMRMSTPE